MSYSDLHKLSVHTIILTLKTLERLVNLEDYEAALEVMDVIQDSLETMEKNIRLLALR